MRLGGEAKNLAEEELAAPLHSLFGVLHNVYILRLPISTDVSETGHIV